MTDSVLVRSSRDGDQFHYLWAARRCLQLLAPLSGIVAITIEGASPLEVSHPGGVKEGEEKIDVAEYHGSQDLAQATLVRYFQLKHSTLRQAHPWTPSELKDTLTGFAKRYTELGKRPQAEHLRKLEFWFVSNRPIGLDFSETIEDAASGAPVRRPSEFKETRSVHRPDWIAAFRVLQAAPV